MSRLYAGAKSRELRQEEGIMSLKKYGAAEPIEPEVDEEVRERAAKEYTSNKREAMLHEQREADRGERPNQD